jgi:hypothetical protein
MPLLPPMEDEPSEPAPPVGPPGATPPAPDGSTGPASVTPSALTAPKSEAPRSGTSETAGDAPIVTARPFDLGPPARLLADARD